MDKTSSDDWWIPFYTENPWEAYKKGGMNPVVFFNHTLKIITRRGLINELYAALDEIDTTEDGFLTRDSWSRIGKAKISYEEIEKHIFGCDIFK